jgi:hypothetical protein
VKECASIAIEEVKKFLDADHDGNLVEKIVFCIFSSEDQSAYESLLPVYFPPLDVDVNAASSESPTRAVSHSDGESPFGSRSIESTAQQQASTGAAVEPSRNVSFYRQPVTEISRYPWDEEEEALARFEDHARDCTECSNAVGPGETHQFLCEEGQAAAKWILQHFHMDENQHVYSTELEIDQRFRVDLPSKYELSRNLLATVERFGQDTRPGRPITGPYRRPSITTESGTEEEKKVEDAKFSRLEQLLIEQQEARAEKEQAKAAAAAKAAQEAAEKKKKGTEEKLVTLEKLIIAQKEEQLKREAAAEAKAAAEKAETEAKAAKEAQEKEAHEEAAAVLLEAARKAREETQAKAWEEFEAKAWEEAEAKAREESEAKAPMEAEESVTIGFMQLADEILNMLRLTMTPPGYWLSLDKLSKILRRYLPVQLWADVAKYLSDINLVLVRDNGPAKPVALALKGMPYNIIAVLKSSPQEYGGLREAELSDRFNINVATLRETLENMQKHGLVYLIAQPDAWAVTFKRETPTLALPSPPAVSEASGGPGETEPQLDIRNMSDSDIDRYYDYRQSEGMRYPPLHATTSNTFTRIDTRLVSEQVLNRMELYAKDHGSIIVFRPLTRLEIRSLAQTTRLLRQM